MGPDPILRGLRPEQIRAQLVNDLNRLTVEELVEQGFDVVDAVRFKAGAARVSSGDATARAEELRDRRDGSGGRAGGASA